MWHMAAKPAPRKGWEAFAQPTQVNQRRYEALRAYVLDGAPLAEAAGPVGYSPSALASLARDLRGGELGPFAHPGQARPENTPPESAAPATAIQPGPARPSADAGIRR